MSTITRADIVGKIRTAIDDILPSGANVTDSFSDDTRDELWQATIHAVTQLSLELPIHLLDVSIHSDAGTVDTSRGFAYLTLPEEFLRFVSLDVTGWAGILTELIEPGSDAERMQRSPWSRGTATKPKAMIDHDEQGNRVIVWWPGDSEHGAGQLTYVAAPTVNDEEPAEEPAVTNLNEEPAANAPGAEVEQTETTESDANIVCAIRDEAEQYIVYRAASIFFEGKKEGDVAEKFRSLSNII